MRYFEIAGLRVAVSSPSWMIGPVLERFLCDEGPADIKCEVIFEKAALPELTDLDKITDDGEKAVYLHGASIYIIDHSDFSQSSIIASCDWSKMKIFFNSVYNNDGNTDIIVGVQGVFFNLLRSVLLSAITLHNGLLIHSASIICNGKGIVFTAPSGTGKTTHTEMWCEKYNAKILDGDVTACRVIDGKPLVYGLPWCGSSGKFLNECVPLDAIVFLEQNEKNSITKLTVSEAVMRLYARCYLYVLDEKTADRVLETITSIVTGIDCYLLKCRPDYEAVELVKGCLDRV
jgi:hypothetical protein